MTTQRLLPFKVGRIMAEVERMNYGIRLHNVTEMWKATKGEGIVYAVVDTGRPEHDDLIDQVEDSADFTGTGEADVQCGHSTHVCGIVAAKEDGKGVVGAAPKAVLMTAKSLNDDGAGSDDSIAKGIRWARVHGAHIINLSLGGPAWAMPKTREEIHKCITAGVFVVAAAGNEAAWRVSAPACFDGVIAVGAVDDKESRAAFSNRGTELDFAACGVNILSTYVGNQYAELTGTSMACPQIGAVMALILSEHLYSTEAKKTPCATVEQMIEHLSRICVDLGPEGWDKDYGYGMPVFNAKAEYAKLSYWKRLWRYMTRW